MGLAGAILGLLGCTVAGAGLVARLLPARGPAGTPLAVLGAGFLTGALLAGGATALTAALPPALSLACVAALLAAAGGAFFLPGRAVAGSAPAEDGPRGVDRWLLALLTMLVLVNLAGMLGEVLERPLLAWDAWKVWAVKPLVWEQFSPAVRFVGVEAWLATDDPLTFTVPGHHYPELVGRFQLFLARLAGGWNDAYPFLPWPLLWVAAVSAFLGLSRLHGVPWRPALLGTLLLAAAPFPAVHGVLPGYMDLWIAVEVLLALGFLGHWLRQRHAGSAVLGIAMLLALAGTKLEGALWALLIAVSTGLALWPPRRIALALGAGAVVLGAWLLVGGFSWQGTGWELTLRPERIELPGLGGVELAFVNRLDAFVRALFELPNWHLLAALPALLGVLLLRRSMVAPLTRLTALFVVFSGLFLLVLFNFTPAAHWAEDLTASNRLTMHCLPGAFWLLLVAHCGEPGGTASRTSA